MERRAVLRHNIRVLTWLFIVGLLISGATAIPLDTEIALLARWFRVDTNADANIVRPSQASAEVTQWLSKVQTALAQTKQNFPFLFYGTDWLAFGHFVIAVAFVGPLRDPVRNRWLFAFGMIACGLVIPYALIFGAVRGIPFWWRLIDCSFGVSSDVALSQMGD